MSPRAGIDRGGRRPRPAVRVPEGLEAFGGVVVEGRDLADLGPVRGRRVAVLSTGSLAVRLVPRLVGEASRVKLFQRDPGWVLPRVPGASWLRRVPRAARALGRAHLRLRVRDREVRDRLTPTGDPARPAPRPRASRSFYRLVDRGALELIAWPVAGIRPRGVQTADGLEHAVDVIVLA